MRFRHSDHACILGVWLLLLTTPLSGQVASDFPGLSPPIRRITLLVDTQAEDPPVYNGAASAVLPGAGDTLELQLFLPEAAGKTTFGTTILFDDKDRRFSDFFTIVQSRAYTTVLAGDARGQESLKHLGLETPLGSDGPARFVLFPRPVPVSVTGLIATFKLLTKQPPPSEEALRFEFTTAIHSTTPPARLWQYRTRHTVIWR